MSTRHWASYKKQGASKTLNSLEWEIEESPRWTLSRDIRFELIDDDIWTYVGWNIMTWMGPLRTGDLNMFIKRSFGFWSS